MVQKKRLVDFGDVANTNTEIETYNSTNINNETNITTDMNNNISISQLLEKVTSKTSKPKKIQRSIYLSEGISKKFDRYGKKFGKGAKSDLIENFLREALKDF